jgi:hypothetical protein
MGTAKGVISLPKRPGVTSGEDVNAYVRSKTLAEWAAREWIAREGGQLEFVSINLAQSLARCGALIFAVDRSGASTARRALAGMSRYRFRDSRCP